MNLVVVIPVGQGREENLAAVLRALVAQKPVRPDGIVLVYDGEGIEDPEVDMDGISTKVIETTIKHVPGREQPRNVGTRIARLRFPDVSHIWFLDSDVVPVPHATTSIHAAYEVGDHLRTLVCPYDWLPPGIRPEGNPDFFQQALSIENDPRWAMFLASPVERVYRNDLSAGLACFSGNLVWNVEEFERVGGYWNEIHHGRCEDGELGLRAVAMDVAIGFQSQARGSHLWHPIQHELALERNTRDVPMLNARHPWVEGSDVFVVERDGRRFDVRCPDCGLEMNTADWWAHRVNCGGDMALPARDLPPQP